MALPKGETGQTGISFTCTGLERKAAAAFGDPKGGREGSPLESEEEREDREEERFWATREREERSEEREERAFPAPASAEESEEREEENEDREEERPFAEAKASL